MKNKTVYILYTNGHKTYKAYWISRRENDIYHGYCLNSRFSFHISHHESGKIHIRKGKDKLPFGNSIPISQIKDIYGLNNFNIGDIAWASKYYPELNNKGKDVVVLIDSRCFYNDSQIQVELYLVKPEYLSSFMKNNRFNKREDSDYRLIQIIRDIEPYLVIHARNLYMNN